MGSKDTSTSKAVEIPESLTVGEFAQSLDLGVGEVVKKLMESGVMATINDTIDYETAAIVGSDLGFEVNEKSEPESDKASAPAQTRAPKPSTGAPRPPIVAVMGHVDHGKTTLLDALRKSRVAAGEAGGITQHLGAYQIEYKDRKITFIDTPGHEAFPALRRHGARLTDLAILVVAADDGVKPQTKEAIKYIQESGVRLIVAINKIDKPDADPARTRQQLSDLGITPEEWDGETVMVDISAKEEKNLDKLLDMVVLVADIEDLRAPAKGPAAGTVVESHQVRGRGAVATLLVEEGELTGGDYIVAGGTYGRVRRLEDSSGQTLQVATPGSPAVVSGLKKLPSFGDQFQVVPNEKEARRLSSEQAEAAAARPSAKKVTRSEELLAALKASEINQLPLVVKADVQGSLQSLTDSLDTLGNEEVKVKLIGTGIGAVNESDVSLAESAQAMIVGFNVSMPVRIKQLADKSGVPVKFYTVIYELLDDIKSSLGDLLEPEVVETSVGKLEIKGVFKTTKTSVICGGQVSRGKIVPGAIVMKLNGKEREELGKVTSVQREQTEVKEVKEGDMCGLNIKTPQKADLEIGDKLEFITREEKQRTL